jgi:putative redox protein
MKLNCTWNEGLKFTASSNSHSVSMDAKPPLGTDTALSPKQLLFAGICGCTGMDVVALLRKYKQPLESFHIDAETTLTEGGYPQIFKEVRLVFKVTGPLDAEKVMEAVTLSQTKYCGVSAMVSPAVPITYTVELNGNKIGSGQADFNQIK